MSRSVPAAPWVGIHSLREPLARRVVGLRRDHPPPDLILRRPDTAHHELTDSFPGRQSVPYLIGRNSRIGHTRNGRPANMSRPRVSRVLEGSARGAGGPPTMTTTLRAKAKPQKLSPGGSLDIRLSAGVGGHQPLVWSYPTSRRPQRSYRSGDRAPPTRDWCGYQHDAGPRSQPHLPRLFGKHSELGTYTRLSPSTGRYCPKWTASQGIESRPRGARGVCFRGPGLDQTGRPTGTSDRAAHHQGEAMARGIGQASATPLVVLATAIRRSCPVPAPPSQLLAGDGRNPPSGIGHQPGAPLLLCPEHPGPGA